MTMKHKILILLLLATVLSCTPALAAQLKSRLPQQAASSSQPASTAPDSSPAQANSMNANSTASKLVSTGTILNAYGSFCGPKTHRCVAFCATPSGSFMDDDYNNFFCYPSHQVAGEPLPCQTDYECQEDDQGQRAKGKWCSRDQVCKVSNIRRM